MKNGKLEAKDLDSDLKLSALMLALTKKGLIELNDYLIARDEVLAAENKKLEKELENNPGMKFMFDLFGDFE